jgi:hypothetical protein
MTKLPPSLAPHNQVTVEAVHIYANDKAWPHKQWVVVAPNLRASLPICGTETEVREQLKEKYPGHQIVAHPMPLKRGT